VDFARSIDWTRLRTAVVGLQYNQLRRKTPHCQQLIAQPRRRIYLEVQRRAAAAAVAAIAAAETYRAAPFRPRAPSPQSRFIARCFHWLRCAISSADTHHTVVICVSHERMESFIISH